MLIGILTMIRSEKACSQRAWDLSGSTSFQPMAWQKTGPGDASSTLRSVPCISGPALAISEGLVVTPVMMPQERAVRISFGSVLSM